MKLKSGMKIDNRRILWALAAAAAVITALYIGMALKTEHPMDKLYTDYIDVVNHVHVVNFKSGVVISELDDSEEVIDELQMKREGIFDAWSKFVNCRNVARFSEIEDNGKEVEEETSLTQEAKGEMVLLPVMEEYYKNGVYLAQDRDTKEWTRSTREQLNIFEMLPFNSELLNRYAKHYKSENRGKFVVFFFSVDPNYLTRTFPDITATLGYDFKAKFTEGTIKMLVYPDTLLPRRIYSIYRIEDRETGKNYEFYLDTYYSENEDYEDMEEPVIPRDIIETAN
ncbi:MAG TPA: hypothetical protein GX691_07885 [Clostridia bacterium]|jgi:hypothetical protein|nr:hypothetical protein [Clostridia bacterium]